MLVVLDSKCERILDCLLLSNDSLSVKELAKRTGYNKRSIYYNITKINEWLESNGIKTLTLKGKGLKLTLIQKNQIQMLLKEVSKTIDYQFSPEERVDIIITTLILNQEKIYVENLMKKCNVSRNSILTDLKNVETTLENAMLHLKYCAKDGYYITGDIIRKRSMFFLSFGRVCSFYQNGLITLKNQPEIDEIICKLNKISSNLNIQYVNDTVYSIAVLFSTIIDQNERTVFPIRDRIEISNTEEYEEVCKYFSNYEEGDRLYLTLHLLGSRLKVTSIQLLEEQDEESFILATALVDEFSRISGIRFDDRKQLIKSLTVHLKSSLYRYKYGVQLANPMLTHINYEYKDLFEITKQTCKCIERRLRVPIPDSEVAYLTLHFGAAIDYNRQLKKLKILIICPNGISTACMLKKEVSILLPNAIIDSSGFLKENTDFMKYDLVISTVSDLCSHQFNDVLIVNPILTDDDRVMIMHKCMDYNEDDTAILDVVFDVAKGYMNNSVFHEFKDELLYRIRMKRTMKLDPTSKYEKGGWLDYLYKNHIHIYEGEQTWEGAIQELGNQMIKESYIKQEYIDSILHELLKIGPYMFITDDFVLAHAKPSDGAIELGVNLGIYRTPVQFEKGKQARFILLISAVDQVSHLRVLSDVVTSVENKEFMNELYNSDSADHALNLIKDYLSNRH